MLEDFFSGYQLEAQFVLRIFYAGLLGALFGTERMLREKEAGIRTHFVVAVGACLMMLISKYGFADLSFPDGSRGADPSRIASQIVSGVGFIGAGMIIYQREALHGLTTAAGIWLIAGIGMAVGAGLYLLPTISCLIVLLVQIILQYNKKWISSHHTGVVTVKFEYTQDRVERLKKMLDVSSFASLELSKTDGRLVAKVTIRTNKNCTDDRLAQIMTEGFVSEINRLGE